MRLGDKLGDNVTKLESGVSDLFDVLTTHLVLDASDPKSALRDWPAIDVMARLHANGTSARVVPGGRNLTRVVNAGNVYLCGVVSFNELRALLDSPEVEAVTSPFRSRRRSAH